MSVKEFADLIGITPQAIYKKIKPKAVGYGRFFKKDLNNKWFISKKDVIRILNGRQK